MKTLIIAITLAMTTVAAAQTESLFFPPIFTPGTALPRTIKIVDPDKQLLATATIGPFGTTFRNAKGELLGSTAVDRQTGIRSYYDPNGKVLYTVKDGVLRDASGQEVPKASIDHLRTIEQLDKNEN
jgi:hypothetical protein